MGYKSNGIKNIRTINAWRGELLMIDLGVEQEGTLTAWMKKDPNSPTYRSFTIVDNRYLVLPADKASDYYTDDVLVEAVEGKWYFDVETTSDTGDPDKTVTIFRGIILFQNDITGSRGIEVNPPATANTFLELSDTPSSYGTAFQYVRMNVTGDGLGYFDPDFTDQEVADIKAHIISTLNPHQVTKTQVGLSNVDNTTDLDKPISTATQTAIDNIDTATASNGLTKVVNDIQLGGTLTKNTTLTAGAFVYDWQFINGFIYSFLTTNYSGVEYYVEDANSGKVANFITRLLSAGTVAQAYMGAGNLSINLITNVGMVVFDNEFQKGLVYSADYSSNFTDRSLVDKAFVDAAAKVYQLYQPNGTNPFVYTDNSEVLNVDGSFQSTGQANSGSKIETFSAAKTFDLNNGNNQYMPISANTVLSLSNKLPGTYIIQLQNTAVVTSITVDSTFGDALDNSPDFLLASGDRNKITVHVDANNNTEYINSTKTA